MLLVLVGVVAALGRVLFLPDLATRADPYRAQLLQALARDDPFEAIRAAEARRFDDRLAAHPRLTLLHILPGAVFLLLAPVQFASRVRRRYARLHRWSGRFLLVTAVGASLSAFYFGLRMPYGGPAEAAAIALFGGLFLVALGLAFRAIRRGDVERHREWMLRAFAIALGIATARIVMPVLDLALTPAGLPPPGVFSLSIWTGWTGTLIVAELWIRRTRRGRAIAVT